MAKLQLNDGRTIPVVKPHLGDQLAVERELGYKPKDFQEVVKLATFQTAFAIFASMNRAGIPTTIAEVLVLDLEALADTLIREPGDPSFDESEDEQSPDPQPAATDATETETEHGPSLTG